MTVLQENISTFPNVPLRIALVIDNKFEGAQLAGQPLSQSKQEKEELCDWARTSQEIDEVLKSTWISYQSIYLSTDQLGTPVFEYAAALRKRFPLSPIYFLHDKEAPCGNSELQRLGIHGLVHRDHLKKELEKRVVNSKTLEVSFNAAKMNRTERLLLIAPEFQVSEAAGPKSIEGYLPVLLEDSLGQEICLFDVYLSLSSGKLVKIFNALEQMDSERVLKFIADGVHWVYIKKSSLDRCLMYFDILCGSLIQNPQISSELKLLHISSLWKCTSENLAAAPLIKMSEEIIDLTASLMERSSSEKDARRLMEIYFKHSLAFEHVMSVFFLSFFFAFAMNLKNTLVLRQLGTIALFHDLGIMKIIEAQPHLASLAMEDEKKMSSPDFAIYATHPKETVKLLTEVGIDDSVILQGVLQHHERRDKSGFPNRSGAGQIHTFSEIVGLCDEFLRFTRERTTLSTQEALKEFRGTLFDRFSLQLIEAFDSLFLWSMLFKSQNTATQLKVDPTSAKT